jgi:hypothetical protein
VVVAREESRTPAEDAVSKAAVKRPAAVVGLKVVGNRVVVKPEDKVVRS